jgi:GTP cyclohydrolase II
LSATVLEIRVPPLPGFRISTPEVVTVTIPGGALFGRQPVVAGSFELLADPGMATLSGSLLTANEERVVNMAESEIVVTLAGDEFEPTLATDSALAAELLAYPASVATSLRKVGEARVPLEDAPETRIIAFRAADGGIEHLAMLVGEPEAVLASGGAPLVRLHSECFTGDLLGSLRCDCGPQLKGALRRMAEDGAGILIYLAQEGRGIGLVNKLRAYTLQDQGLDTLDANRALGYGADERNFLVAATMLRLLNAPRVRLLTNNPDKISGLAACGIEVVTREQHAYAGNGVNDRYLATKAERFGHMLEE